MRESGVSLAGAVVVFKIIVCVGNGEGIEEGMDDGSLPRWGNAAAAQPVTKLTTINRDNNLLVLILNTSSIYDLLCRRFAKIKGSTQHQMVSLSLRSGRILVSCSAREGMGQGEDEMKKLVLPLAVALGLLLVLMIGAAASRAEPPLPVRTLNSGQHFLPPYPAPRDRFGFDSLGNDPLTNYDVAQLNAGWYTDWGASGNPPHPDDLTFAQLISFKAGSDPHDPALVTVSPSRATIAQIAAAHPGSLWMMSNEPDSLYQGTPLYPEVYAHVYHDIYHYIKTLDPTALIANGGIVQPTPCRMQYLDIVWDTYQQAYSKTMPVDVWNIHAFVLREVYNDWGASTPPGVPTSCGIDYKMREADDLDIFRDNLIAFRQWMKDKGEQDKPLIISEYGILWPDWLKDEDGGVWSAARVGSFMLQTFDMFLYEAFPDVGYPADDYRLVQAWAWYSISETYYNGKLFDPSTRQLSTLGHTYADYTVALTDVPYADLSVYDNAVLDTSPLQHIVLGDPYETTSATLPIWMYVANLGKLPVSDVPVVAYLPQPVTNTITLPTRYAADIAPFLAASVVLTQPARYEFDPQLLIVADPGHTINDPRLWNNVTTVTMPSVIDARPDLVVSATTWSIRPPETTSGTLNVTWTVANAGIWPAPPVSGTLYLSGSQGSLLLPHRRFAVPALEFGDQVSFTKILTLPGSTGDLYRLVIEADSDGVVDEPDEANNQATIEVDARPDLLISMLDWHMQPPRTVDGWLSFTMTVSNAGIWPAQPVSGTRFLSNTSGTLLLDVHRFPIPAVAAGRQVTIVQETALPPLDEDFYRLALNVDSDEVVDERDEDNNWAEKMIPIYVTATLEPGATTVLTSNSGHLTFIFPTGTVTTPTEIRFTPLWLPELPSGPLISVSAFQLAAYRGEQPVSLTMSAPVTVTWRYTNTDVAGLDENRLNLYRLMEGDRWRRIYCSSERRQPDENQVSTCIQQLGVYVFGQGYELYLPLVMRSNG
jgi:hypothetical protein